MGNRLFEQVCHTGPASLFIFADIHWVHSTCHCVRLDSEGITMNDKLLCLLRCLQTGTGAWHINSSFQRTTIQYFLTKLQKSGYTYRKQTVLEESRKEKEYSWDKSLSRQKKSNPNGCSRNKGAEKAGGCRIDLENGDNQSGILKAV